MVYLGTFTDGKKGLLFVHFPAFQKIAFGGKDID